MTGVLVLQPVPFSRRPITSEEEAMLLLGDTKANLIVAGHLHYASYGVPCGQRYHIIDSVGFPDGGDHRIGYARMTWNEHEWQVKNHRLHYDYPRVVEDLRVCGAPFGESVAQMIHQGRFRPIL